MYKALIETLLPNRRVRVRWLKEREQIDVEVSIDEIRLHANPVEFEDCATVIPGIRLVAWWLPARAQQATDGVKGHVSSKSKNRPFFAT